MKSSITRREALLTGLAAWTTLSSFSFLAIKKYNISLQLHSVKEAMQNDPSGTLAKIAHIGYRQIEPKLDDQQKLYGFTASEFRQRIDDLGLSVLSCHSPLKKTDWNEATQDFTDAYKKTLEAGQILGTQLLVISEFDWALNQISEVQKGIEVMNRLGEMAGQSNLHLGYHNNVEEFEQMYQGQPIYDYMLSQWDVNKISQQLDLGNMAGADPLVYLRKYPHHYASLHIKDWNKNSRQHTYLGEGQLDLEGILSFAKRSTQIQYWVLEQEQHGSQIPLHAMEGELNRFKRYGFIG